MRELEQAVRRILLKHRYEGDERVVATDRASALARAVEAGTVDADALLSGYCALHYERCGNYQEVARRTGLDVRTVRRYLALKALNGDAPAPTRGRRGSTLDGSSTRSSGESS